MQKIPASEEEHEASIVHSRHNNDNETVSGVRDSLEDVTTTAVSFESSKLVLWQGVALLTADCLGVGVLALPYNVQSLGYVIGLTFLILNFPINFFAGDLLSAMAVQLEGGTLLKSGHNELELDEHNDSPEEHEMEMTRASSSKPDEAPASPTMHHRRNNDNKTVETSLPTPTSNKAVKAIPVVPDWDEQGTSFSIPEERFEDEHIDSKKDDEHGVHAEEVEDGSSLPHAAVEDTTRDLIAISKAIFESPKVTKLVLLIYYTNLFLVLGDYILVMGRAVSAMFLDQICLPMAGAIASLLMFLICQLRTMSLLGRKVSLASLLAMLVVLLQCLFHHRSGTEGIVMIEDNVVNTRNIWAKFSAFASIGFAIGSQKLFLNIRHELKRKEDASKVLAGSLSTFGLAYIGVILLAGPNPPSFLFDAIPVGKSRRIAGLLLWGHVAVSYAINSQALCSSMDRYMEQSSIRWERVDDRKRWFLLTMAIAISSYLVSNAVPFFKDLVALIGALTSVPLTLTLPALLHRQFHRWNLFRLQWHSARRQSCTSIGSYALLWFSLVFLVLGLAGAVSSIGKDWLNQGKPFSCR